jgi:polyphosphate kinase
LRRELKDIMKIQLKDNVKVRILDNELKNNYVPSAGNKKIRSQVEIYNYLRKKIIKPVEVSSN